jgi:hypothetical protein
MDPIELQRLIDGELNADDRRRLLLEMDRQPQHWRGVALSLIEEVTFRREVAGFVKGNEAASLTDFAVGTGWQDVDKPVALGANHRVPSQRSEVPWWQLATAACLMIVVGFGAGYGLNMMYGISTKNPSVPPTIAAMKDQPNTMVASDTTKPSATSKSRLPRAIGEIELVSDVGLPQASARSTVPLYEVDPEHVQQMMEAQYRQINEWNKRFKDRGFQIDWKPEMMQSQLPDGRAVVIPVNQWNYVPIGQ